MTSDVLSVFSPLDTRFMQRAIDLAQEAAKFQEVPVGALVVRENSILSEAFNQPISLCDPSAHAEMLALRRAALESKNYRLPGATLYVTIEPCTMCLGAIVHARIARLVYGAREPKSGALHSQSESLEHLSRFNHRLIVEEGCLAEDCSATMSAFFQQRRLIKAQRKE